MIRNLRHALEAAGFFFIVFVFSRLSPLRASALGGALAKCFGPLFPLHRRALENLSHAFPLMPVRDQKRVLRGMWENLGRVAAEYCHLSYFLNAPDFEIVGEEWLQKALSAKAGGVLLVGGHLGNLQMISVAAARCGVDVGQFYRQANNPWVDRGMRKLQGDSAAHVVPKSAGVSGLLRTLKEGKPFVLFVDQKFSEGHILSFFGKPAPTMVFPAALARRFGYAIIPARVERICKLTFRVTFFPPLSLGPDDSLVMQEINHILENWIHERPEQWMWIHNRWFIPPPEAPGPAPSH